MSDLVRLDRIGALVVPPKADLLMARRAIHLSPDLQRVFDDAASGGWDLERLIGALEDGFFRVLGERVGAETVRYLAEEFEARDKTRSLLVSAETGLAVAQVDSDGFYQPDPVARDGTDKLATPAIRLQPDVEAAIIQHHHVREQESRLASKLQARARSSELQRAEGDARLRIATRSGRKSLAAQLLEELPALLLDHRGASGRLLSLCRVNEPVPSSHSLKLELTLFSHVSMLVADGLASNFRHDAYGSTRERIRSSWTRILAKAIANQAHLVRPATYAEVSSDLGPGLVMADPDVINAICRQEGLCLPPGSPAAILRGPSYLVLTEEPQLDAYESQARWNVDASISVVVHLDPGSLHPLVFTGVVESGTATEVLG